MNNNNKTKTNHQTIPGSSTLRAENTLIGKYHVSIPYTVVGVSSNHHLLQIATSLMRIKRCINL